MGTRTDREHSAALDDFADTVGQLIMEEFCVGSDALGPDGWRIAGGVLRALADGFDRAARANGYEVTSDSHRAS